MRTRGIAAAAALVAACAAPAAAQDAAREQDRFKISQMERMLEGAVEHGAAVIRDRLTAALPSEVLISQNARARGFRLEGYGVFFDVAVPSLQGTMPWIFHTLDQNDLGLASALAELRAHVDADGDERLQQALQRIELQVAPIAPADTPPPAAAPGAPAPTTTPVSAGSRPAGGSAVSATALPGSREHAPAAAPAAPPAVDPVLADPREAFHSEVRDDVVDALLEYASSLGLANGEWVTVALRPDDDLPAVAPTADEEFTMTIRVRGADLAAFRTGQLTRDQARQRVEVRVF